MSPVARRVPIASLSWDDCRLLVESVADYAIFMLDAAGFVATWNLGASRIKGYSVEEIVGRHFSEFYTAEDRASGEPERALAAATQEGRFAAEGWRLRKDGSRFWASVVITALRGPGGELRGFAKVTRDLSDRRAAEEQLRRSEERFRLLVESVGDYAIYMLDPDGRVTTWNRGAERLKGYTAEEILGQSFVRFFPTEDAEAGKPARELEAAREHGRFEEEGWRIRKDGSRFWANVVVSPLRDARGELLGYAKVTRDLTARREAEERERDLVREQAARTAAEESRRRIEESEQRYRALSRRLEVILEGIAEGITVEDREGRLTFANGAAARMAGLASGDELVGAAPDLGGRFEVLDEQGRVVPSSGLPGRRALAEGVRCAAVLQVHDAASGRTSWSHARATPILDSSGQPELAITIWSDVTAERRAQLHARLLGEVSFAVAGSLDEREMLAKLAGAIVPDVADWCSIHVLDGDQLVTAAVTYADPSKRDVAETYEREYPPSPTLERGVWHVLRSGVTTHLAEVPEDVVTAAARDARHLELLRRIGLRSLVIAPIRVRERVMGTITLVGAESNRRLEEPDRVFAEELGRRAGAALETASAYAAERRARTRLELLARGGEALAAHSPLEERLAAVARSIVPTVGDVAFFEMPLGGGVRRIAAGDPELVARVESLPADPLDCAGRAIVLTDETPAGEARHPTQTALLQELAGGALVAAPVRNGAELLGCLAVCTRGARRPAPDDVRLVEELARRAGLAMVQARLLAAAQEAAQRSEAAARRAEEANRIKDDFLATVSHELRTPLNVILGWSSLLRGRPLEADALRAIDVIHRNAEAQAHIVDDILDVSRIITGKLRLTLDVVDLELVAREAIEVVQPSADAKALRVELVTPATVGPVVGDADRLRQVFWNLLTNAVKFTDPGGRVTMTVGRDGPQVRVTVEDTGRGIDPELLPLVFDRFQQGDSSTTRRFGGLGLGLSIVRHLVEMHGGTVRASSEGRGRGARFEVVLPVRAVAVRGPSDRPSPAPATPRRAAESSLAGTRIVVVDDDDDARELIEHVLAEAGAEVVTAPTAAAGFQAVLRERPDVLVSDVGMPEEDGHALVRRMRESGGAAAGTPAVALTAYTRTEDRAQALAAGFDDHVGKPVHPDELVRIVARLARHAPLPNRRPPR